MKISAASSAVPAAFPAHDTFEPGWWRFSKYTLEAGVIRPAPGAKLKSFSVADAYSGREAMPPYQHLLNLLSDVEFKPSDGINLLAPTPQSEAAILQWCGENGLLGVMSQQGSGEFKFTFAMPNSGDPQAAKAFWQQHTEPLVTFLEAAQSLRTALSEIYDNRPRGLAILNFLISPIGVSAAQMNGGFGQQWRLPSVLSALALMAWANLKNDWRVLRCKRQDCRRIFTSANYQSAFCSPTCAHTAHKRMQRQREKASLAHQREATASCGAGTVSAA